jgi:tungstate transport system permease protein
VIDEIIESFIVLLNSSEILGIVSLSILVSNSAVIMASLIGIPVGILLGLKKNKSSSFTISILNTGMGLPPVFVGLVVYLMLYRQGPLGNFEILFTPIAMIIAQSILTIPIIIGITRSTILDLPEALPEMIESMGGTKFQKLWILFREARSGIIIAIIVALGRAFSEVGAILIVGGNIRFSTRVLTTSIITEIGQGNRGMAVTLGLILLMISYTLVSFMTYFHLKSSRKN